MKLTKGHRLPLQNGYTISRKSVEGIGYFARLSPDKRKMDMYWRDASEYCIIVTIENKFEIQEAKKVFSQEVSKYAGIKEFKQA